MWVDFVVVRQPGGQLLGDGLCVGCGADADIIALERADESLRHAVGLRAADRGGTRDEADVAGEAPGFTADVGTAVVGKPLDRLDEAVYARRWRPSGREHLRR